MIAEELPKRTGGGRKPSFLLSDEVLEQVAALSHRGLNQRMIAGYYGISVAVWEIKKKKFPELREAYLRGKSQGVDFTAKKLMELIVAGNKDAILYYLKHVGQFEVPDLEEADEAANKKPEPIKITVTCPIEAAKMYQQIMQGGKV